MFEFGIFHVGNPYIREKRGVYTNAVDVMIRIDFKDLMGLDLVFTRDSGSDRDPWLPSRQATLLWGLKGVN